MWCEGCIASDGVEKIAELGSTSVRTIGNAVPWCIISFFYIYLKHCHLLIDFEK